MKMPPQKKFNTNFQQIRDIDINPTKLIGENEHNFKRFDHSSISTDS